MERVKLTVKGMTCEGCVNSVTNALKGVAGVKDAKVTLEGEQAQVTYDPAQASIEKLKEAVKSAGYEAV